MKLIKNGYTFTTSDETVIKAYKLNGFTEAVEDKPQPEVKPVKTTKAKK